MNKLILIAILCIISVSAKPYNYKPYNNYKPKDYGYDGMNPDSEYQNIGETEFGFDMGSEPESEESTPETPADTTTGAETGATGFEADCLNAHNTERTALGITPLTYSAKLAAAAQQWANVIAGDNSLHHSQNRDNTGENLAMGSKGKYDTARLIGLWTDEKRFFKNGAFPDVSTTGNWGDVGHYTQMIWSTTTEVGCAVADNNSGKSTYMVCQYSPAGNRHGKNTY